MSASYLASRHLVTPPRLRDFFAPRDVAMVGASDNSGWARLIVASSAITGFDGKLVPVHPKAKSAFGLPAVPSLRDLPEPVDLAFILHRRAGGGERARRHAGRGGQERGGPRGRRPGGGRGGPGA